MHRASIADDFLRNTCEAHGDHLISNPVNQIQSLKSSCNVWQNFWLTIVYDLESFPRATLANTNTFFSVCLFESFPIGPERKHKVDYFALFYTTRFFSQELEL